MTDTQEWPPCGEQKLWQQGFRLGWLFAQKKRLTANQVAGMFGITARQAYYMLDVVSEFGAVYEDAEEGGKNRFDNVWRRTPTDDVMERELEAKEEQSAG